MSLSAQQIGLILLRDLGIVSLNTASPADQANLITSGDLDTVALSMTQAYQEIFDELAAMGRTQPGSAVLYAPTAVTLTVTDGSAEISSVTTFASWMPGCTIRITGDAQDNEILSATRLARPFIGTGGSGVSATVYCDAVTLDETHGRVLSPMIADGSSSVTEATSRKEFILGSASPYTGVSAVASNFARLPFYAIGAKPAGQHPAVYYLDVYFDPALAYVPRRIRLSPMPTQKQSLVWSALINPPRITAADIDGASHADPGVKISGIPNGWVESIFVPIARQINSGGPRFKNDTIRGEIARQYDAATARLKGLTGGGGMARTVYL